MSDSSDLLADICIIGAGSGGLSAAAGAVQMGASVVLVERQRMGGDCLNTGCVPSKSLLAAAHAAHTIRHSGRFGVTVPEPTVEMAGVYRHIHAVVAAIAPHDSRERFEKLGVRVVAEEGRFIGPQQLQAGPYTIHARRFIIATGSSPHIPALPGLASLPFLTNENIFELQDLPSHLLVLGGGPIGVELGQAFRRLGAQVTLLARTRLLPGEEPELVAMLGEYLASEGLQHQAGLRFLAVASEAAGVALRFEQNGQSLRLTGSHLLVATGRQANLESLCLDAAGVAHTPRAIQVDSRLRTTNPRIFAIGDVAGPYQFTHMAGYQAGIVLRNILFRLPARADYRAVPRVTYCDPELARVGLTEAEARALGGPVQILEKSFTDNDRARTEGVNRGAIKVVLGKKGRILGVSILGPHAGELIQPWILAMSQNLPIGAMTRWVAPYPTLGEISKSVAGSFYTPTLFSEKTHRLVRLLARFG